MVRLIQLYKAVGLRNAARTGHHLLVILWVGHASRCYVIP